MTPEDDAADLDLIERTVASRVVHQGRYLTFRVDTVERADGSRATRDIAGHPGAVAIVAVDDQDRVLLVRQFRAPVGRVLLEIPAGTLERGEDGATEDPLLAARRELEEETGMRAGCWEQIAAFYSAPGFTEERMHLFLATDLTTVGDGRLEPDHDEHLHLASLPWRDAVAAIDRGEIMDAKSIVGLFWLARRREQP